MRTEFVGRRRELTVLEEHLGAAIAGRPGVVLCRGEPGIGKTRLAEELSAVARAAGVRVVWGLGAESAGAPPYWPWRQILRAVGEDVDLSGIADEHRLTGDLAALAPELFVVRGGPAPTAASDEDRFRLFDAVARLLRLVTRDRPVLIVLDDAHWADVPSLILLQHVARSLTDEHLLIVVNHRDTERLPDVLAAGVGGEARALDLDGLTVSAVGAQLATLIGHDVDLAEVERVHGRTGGNPFYVGEIGRTLAEPQNERSDGSVPVSVREAIAARLKRLPPPTVRLLQAASIVGRRFPLSVVAPMVESPVLDCLTRLDEGVAAGLVVPSATPGRHSFVHDLVRDAVEADLGSADRALLHRSAARAVEDVYAGRLEPHLSDLARHWAAAAVAGERTEAVGWIRRAAEEAMRRLAYEEGARLFRLALAVAAAELGDGARCRLLLSLGAALRLAGEMSDRLPICLEAAELARRLGRADLLAEAAVALEGGEGDLECERTVRRLCEEALAAPAVYSAPLRARVLANLSDSCMYVGDLDAASSASTEALAVADASGDRTAIATALRARQLVATGPDGVEERARLAERMLALGRDGQDPASRMWAHLWRIDVAFELGDLPTVAAELEDLARCTEEMRGPVARWHLLQARAVLAQAQGRFADARRLADEAVAVLPSSATGREAARINRTALLSAVGLHDGEQVDLSGLLDDGAGPGGALDFPTEGVIFSAAAAFFLAAGGRLEDARRVYIRLGPPARWRPIPHATTASYALGIGTAIALDRSDDVAVLRERLAPFRGRHVSDGAGAIAYNGPAALYLGIAAAHLNRFDDAVADLELAARSCASSGAAGFQVHARYELAAVLRRRAGTGDLARARTMAADVAKHAGALGMTPWVTRAQTLMHALDGEQANVLTPREREVAVLVAEGLTNRQIAGRLYLSERTAQNHVQHVLTKLALPNRSQIAVWIATRR